MSSSGKIYFSLLELLIPLGSADYLFFWICWCYTSGRGILFKRVDVTDFCFEYPSDCKQQLYYEFDNSLTVVKNCKQ